MQKYPEYPQGPPQQPVMQHAQPQEYMQPAAVLPFAGSRAHRVISPSLGVSACPATFDLAASFPQA